MDKTTRILNALCKPKHFTDAWASCWADETHIRCQVPEKFDGSGILTFRISQECLDNYPAYTIVNAIWDYVAEYVL